jgi:hypothetical protein
MSTSKDVASESPKYKGVPEKGCLFPTDCRGANAYRKLCGYCAARRDDTIRELVQTTTLTFDEIAARVGWSRRTVSVAARSVPRVREPADSRRLRVEARAEALALPMLPARVHGGRRFVVEIPQ